MHKQTRRKFGRDRIADRRDYDFPLRVQASRRRSRHWRLGPVTDQLETPHCVGHAWWAWFAAAPIRQQPITPDGIYTLAQYFDEWQGQDYDGTSVRGAAKLLTVTGHITEYRWEFDLPPAVDYVLERGPLVLGVNWYAGMMDPDRDGIIRPTGRSQGGHAVLLYGIDTRRGFASLRNSWGREWGLDGNCLLAFEDLERLLDEDGECCAATEVRAALPKTGDALLKTG